MLASFGSIASELNRDENNLALAGYDPVEYVQFNHALKGFTDIETILNGTRYRFRDRENRALFIAKLRFLDTVGTDLFVTVCHNPVNV